MEDALLHGGPPCGTYVWVNRATSKRSGECPDGDVSVTSVANANLLLDPRVVVYDIGLFFHKTQKICRYILSLFKDRYFQCMPMLCVCAAIENWKNYDVMMSSIMC